MSQNLLNVRELPKRVKNLLIFMLILEATFYIVPIFVELESAIFYVCSLHYYLISAFLVFGYLRLFYKLFNLLLIQFESPLIPNEQKS